MPAVDEARLLLIPAELPVWEIVRIGYSAKDENAVDVTQVIIPGTGWRRRPGCGGTRPPAGPTGAKGRTGRRSPRGDG